MSLDFLRGKDPFSIQKCWFSLNAVGQLLVLCFGTIQGVHYFAGYPADPGIPGMLEMDLHFDLCKNNSWKRI